MRKELKSKSRRKWLIGGSLAFASVALLTTGFATWVIGTQKTSGDGKVHIGVDTAEDNSVKLTFNLDTDDTIFIAEADGADPEPDWDIKIKDLNVVVGQDFYNSLKDKTDLKIAFELQKDGANSVTADMVGVRGETGSPWNYIKVKSESEFFNVSLPSTYPTDGEIYDINDTPNNPDKTFSFTWGSYFGEKAPSVFYEENETTGDQNSHDYYRNAVQELQAMKTALEADTLTLTATFIYEK